MVVEMGGIVVSLVCSPGLLYAHALPVLPHSTLTLCAFTLDASGLFLGMYSTGHLPDPGAYNETEL